MKAIATILLGSVMAVVVGGDEPKHKFVPEKGFVPTKEVAIKIAVAIWEPIYGADKIASEKPYQATLDEGVWTVEGTFHGGANARGGVALAEISKTDGKILRVSHGK